MATSFTSVQFDPVYDVHKMRTLVDDLERQFRALGLEVESSAAGVHNTLTGRGVSDTHPISSITGLVAALAAKASQIDLDALELRVAVNEVTLERNRIERYFLGE